jgi:two-component system CheB/CheR fusion protein
MSDNDPNAQSPPPTPASGDGEEIITPFPIVGIGASAGGLEAFRQLLSKLPRNPGMSLLMVQHLEPHQESILPGLLGRATPLPVREAQDGMVVERDHVYVIPPNTTMDLEKARLRIRPRVNKHRVAMPVDHLLRSLAHELGPRAIGVILSGEGTDGTLGLTEIKAQGGITFAQDSSARNEGMPRSAIAEGCVDYVLPPERIVEELLRIAGRQPHERAAEADEPVGDDEPLLQRIFNLLQSATGVDFSKYKRNTIRRRIQRRMALANVGTLAEYVHRLEADRVGVHVLYQDLLIRVTSFFRDPATFDALQQTAFPALVQDRAPDTPLRIWVAGCSTGEEVYSLAICLVEYMEAHNLHMPIKILATDISESALEKARSGRYIENIELDVSAERLHRYFVREDNHYRISKTIRDQCVFARHDVTRDPPFSRMDLISCRNLLIYLDLPLQRRVVPAFHYALQSGGLLVLGRSEGLNTFGDLFTPLDERNKVYVRRPVSTPGLLDYHMEPGPTVPGAPRPAVPAGLGGLDIQREADRVLLARYAPAGVVVDENLNILQFRGRTGPYLEPAPGTASLDLLKMVREGLLIELRAALGQAKAQNVAVRKEGLQVRDQHGLRPVSIDVVPIRVPFSGERSFLILFEDATHPRPTRPGERGATAAPGVPQTTSAEQAQEEEVTRLRQELDATREFLQAVIEEHEATSEELKSANEEILSSNEELQSTNEELQTAKEEMQSANEELITLNDELKHRNLELGKVNDDLVNLLAGVNIPIVMVGRDLRIRRFTPHAEKLLNLIPSDVGRPIGDLKPNINLEVLEKPLREVIETLTPQEFEVQDREGRWYSLRVRPYVTVDKKVDGATLVAVGIDALKRSLEQLRQARDFAETTVETVDEPLLVLDRKMRVQRANRAYCQMFRTTAAETQGQFLYDLAGGWWSRPQLRQRLGQVVNNNSQVSGIAVEGDYPGLGRRTFLVSAGPISVEGAEAPMLLLAIQDVTEARRDLEQARALAQEQRARAEAELANRMKDEFLAMLSHELRNPLAPISAGLDILRRRAPEDPVTVRTLDIAGRQVKYMARLLDDLLDVGRITQGKIRLRKEPVDLAHLVDDAVEAARPSAMERGLHLEVALPPEPVLLEGDPVRLAQVVGNLVNNAIKFTPRDGRIDVALTADGGTGVLRVRDTGIGIAPEMLPRVFDLFVQADRSLARTTAGLGIGLTLVRRLAELHGGTAEAHSAGLGQGSEFIVRLPLTPVPAPRPAAPASSAAPPRSLRVLVVDDAVEIAETLTQLLTDLGHETRMAHSGAEADEVARAFRPEAVFLDLGLPDHDGYEVARRLRNLDGLDGLLLVALSGYGQEEDLRRAREAGFDLHLLKPVRAADLQNALAQKGSAGV